ncbi:hypothetical protein SERLADRAFT_375165 [Serpula lacrymans var. lacrymans S7.9]|uniref:DDE Tnp4 domain-containing protein n=1 Tax=Serpula lacrymans var. lacrymans (strain S7.9) TaxID=578457 RepID=F8PEM6_SERL9|nr:uncharacterized protein SERLADRAFT_375165 [Serpula lacrymans var. lacrymans S7.9]EGO18422.1 hypothetical protein SERLADRAFT_375165 [Serpula lacrymans var. lacrymans S7.9]
MADPHIDTPWQCLLSSHSDCAFITTMGFDAHSFDAILSAGFEKMWYERPIVRFDTIGGGKSRPGGCSLDAAGALGLVLHYLNSTMCEVSLQQIFALIPSTVLQYNHFGLNILLETLRNMPDTAITWPKGAKFEENTSLLTHLVFSKCLIIAANLNVPGSWHDSWVAQPIYKKLRTKMPDKYYLVADTAFPRSTTQISGRICAPIKAGQHIPGTREDVAEKLAFNRELLSYCQTAELVGINKIKNVYMKEWTRGVDQEELWRSFEDMLFSDNKKDCISRFHIVASYE